MARSSARDEEIAFPDGVRAFFAGLAEHNDREWFTAHRDEYDALVREPLDLLAGLAEQRYGAAKVFRPNRDVRFSTDKSPYKLNGAMWAGGVGGVYVQVSVDGVWTGGGLYQPSRDQLSRARTAIDEHATAGKRLATIVRTLGRDDFDLAGPDLKTAPRGFASDHPRIELLRLQHYAALTTLPLDATIDEVQASWRAVEPLIDWVHTHVGPRDR